MEPVSRFVESNIQTDGGFLTSTPSTSHSRCSADIKKGIRGPLTGSKGGMAVCRMDG